MLSEMETAALIPEHENVVHYYRAWQQNQHLYLQMELCDGGTLRVAFNALFLRTPHLTLISSGLSGTQRRLYVAA